MNKNIFQITYIAVITLFSSCTTYLIPIDSFKKQFAGIDSSKFKEVKVKGPALIGYTYQIYTYSANPIETIKCVDKENKPAELRNSPSIETRFTYGKNNKRTIFYFDRIYVTDTSITGVQSRFFPSMIKTIPLNEVTKIEVQDGKKNFHYIDK